MSILWVAAWAAPEYQSDANDCSLAEFRTTATIIYLYHEIVFRVYVILPPNKPWTPGCLDPGLYSIADTRSARHNTWNKEKTSRKPGNKHHESLEWPQSIGGSGTQTPVVQFKELSRGANIASAPTCDKHRQTTKDNVGQRVERRVLFNSTTSLYSPFSLQDKIKLAHLIYCFHFPKEQHWTDERQLTIYPPLAVVLCFAVFGCC